MPPGELHDRVTEPLQHALHLGARRLAGLAAGLVLDLVPQPGELPVRHLVHVLLHDILHVHELDRGLVQAVHHDALGIAYQAPVALTESQCEVGVLGLHQHVVVLGGIVVEVDELEHVEEGSQAGAAAQLEMVVQLLEGEVDDVRDVRATEHAGARWGVGQRVGLVVVVGDVVRDVVRGGVVTVVGVVRVVDGGGGPGLGLPSDGIEVLLGLEVLGQERPVLKSDVAF